MYLHEKFLVLSLFSFTLDNTSLGWSNLFLFLFQRRKFFFYTFDEIYTRGLIDRSNNTIESQPFHYTRRALNFTLEVLLANLDIFINVEVRVRIEQLSIIRSIDRSTDRSSTENKRKKKKIKPQGISWRSRPLIEAKHFPICSRLGRWECSRTKRQREIGE